MVIKTPQVPDDLVNEEKIEQHVTAASYDQNERGVYISLCKRDGAQGCCCESKVHEGAKEHDMLGREAVKNKSLLGEEARSRL